VVLVSVAHPMDTVVRLMNTAVLFKPQLLQTVDTLVAQLVAVVLPMDIVVVALLTVVLSLTVIAVTQLVVLVSVVHDTDTVELSVAIAL